jgi:hypothetical protein
MRDEVFKGLIAACDMGNLFASLPWKDAAIQAGVVDAMRWAFQNVTRRLEEKHPQVRTCRRLMPARESFLLKHVSQTWCAGQLRCYSKGRVVEALTPSQVYRRTV